jgi:hypothetical protein
MHFLKSLFSKTQIATRSHVKNKILSCEKNSHEQQAAEF